MNLLNYVVKLGFSIGIILLNIGILVWILGNTNDRDDRIAIDIIYGSVFLLLLSLVIYIR